jgi:hypothetical protein
LKLSKDGKSALRRERASERETFPTQKPDRTVREAREKCRKQAENFHKRERESGKVFSLNSDNNNKEKWRQQQQQRRVFDSGNVVKLKQQQRH